MIDLLQTANTPQTGLFALAERKLSWIDARQRLLAQNIANADTPGYQARDVTPFADMLGKLGVQPAQTSPMHLAGFLHNASSGKSGLGEHAPDGNAVVTENQLTKVADDESSQALVGNIWHSYMGMFMTALGHAG